MNWKLILFFPAPATVSDSWLDRPVQKVCTKRSFQWGKVTKCVKMSEIDTLNLILHPLPPVFSGFSGADSPSPMEGTLGGTLDNWMADFWVWKELKFEECILNASKACAIQGHKNQYQVHYYANPFDKRALKVYFHFCFDSSRPGRPPKRSLGVAIQENTRLLPHGVPGLLSPGLISPTGNKIRRMIGLRLSILHSSWNKLILIWLPCPSGLFKLYQRLRYWIFWAFMKTQAVFLCWLKPNGFAI